MTYGSLNEHEFIIWNDGSTNMNKIEAKRIDSWLYFECPPRKECSTVEIYLEREQLKRACFTYHNAMKNNLVSLHELLPDGTLVLAGNFGTEVVTVFCGPTPVTDYIVQRGVYFVSQKVGPHAYLYDTFEDSFHS